MHYVNQCSWPRIYKRRTEELLAKNINQPLSQVTAKRMKNLRFSSKFHFIFISSVSLYIWKYSED